jgi:hypothetical protein
VVGGARLALVLESGADVAVEVHRWDVAGLAPGRTVTLTAMIALDPWRGTAGSAEAEYSLTIRSLEGAVSQLAALAGVCLAAPDAYEPQDIGDGSGGAGALLRPGGRQTRSLNAPWDVDYGRVTAEGGRRYILWTEGLGSAADTVMELYDARGGLVAASDDANGPGSRIVWTAPADGSYRVVVRAWAPGSEGCGAGYTLRLQTEPPVPKVPEDLEGASKIRLPLVVRPG